MSEPMFGTDNGPAHRCGSTIYGYDVIGQDGAAATIAATCYGCRGVTYFVTDAVSSAAALSAAHRASAIFQLGGKR